jgi:hypothetical protein
MNLILWDNIFNFQKYCSITRVKWKAEILIKTIESLQLRKLFYILEILSIGIDSNNFNKYRELLSLYRENIY